MVDRNRSDVCYPHGFTESRRDRSPPIADRPLLERKADRLNSPDSVEKLEARNLHAQTRILLTRITP